MDLVINKYIIQMFKAIVMFIMILSVFGCQRDLGEVLECLYLAEEDISHSEFLDIANAVGSSMSMKIVDHDIPPDPRDPNKPSILIRLWGSQSNASISHIYRPSICVREETSLEEAIAVLDAFKSELNKRKLSYQIETRADREEWHQKNRPKTRVDHR